METSPYICGQDLDLAEPLSKFHPHKALSVCVGVIVVEFVDIYSWLVDTQDRLNFETYRMGEFRTEGRTRIWYDQRSLRYGVEGPSRFELSRKTFLIKPTVCMGAGGWCWFSQLISNTHLNSKYARRSLKRV